MIIEYRVVSTGKVLDRITGDSVDELVYETGQARDVVAQITRRLPDRQRMAALASWSNGYVQLVAT
ncbi:hypothetical protein [Micromonospora sp. NPDC003816]|uniref:hypothetical protein n=1 Tax=Micromonospora sp. NPDC003816 TaxID=3364224 RepID=UPI00369639FB